MATYPDIEVGDLWTADLATSMLPQTVRKGADQSTAPSTIALVNDSELFLSVEANASYFYEGWILYKSGSAAGDLRLNYAYPAGATLLRTDWGHDSATAVAFGSVDTSAATTGDNGRGAVASTATTLSVYAQGDLIIGSTAGTFQVRFAQVTSDATVVTLCAGSRIKLTRYA